MLNALWGNLGFRGVVRANSEARVLPSELSLRVELLACILLAWLPSSILFAQRIDSFESDAPRWRLVESDCRASLGEHEISTLMPRSGRACELFEINCSAGQQALMAYPIEPTAVLNEFQPSVWIRCAAGNIRLGVRIVFPNAVHPVTQNRLTTVVWGDTYQETGHWQRLQIGRIADLLQQDTAALRQLFDHSPNLEQPLIDSIVLNVYTGPGRYRVQVDELALTGMIPLASVGVPVPPNWRELWQWNELVEPQLSSASFPIWLQHRGEEPAWIASLGFNGLWLADVPTPAQLALIAQARLSAVSPPPMHGIEFDQQQLSALRGWVVGVALNREQMDVARRNSAAAESLPEILRRPLVGEALEHYWMFSRMVSQTIVPAPDPASAGDYRHKHAWLANTLQTIRIRNDGWVSVVAGPNPSIVQQCLAADQRMLGEQTALSAPGAVNPIGFRHEVAGAVMAGAKGILVRTHAPLADPISIQTTVDRAMQAAIRWCQHDLKLWSPWLLWGHSMPPPIIDRSEFAAARWRVRDADLMIVQNAAAHSQWSLPATRGTPLVVRLNEGTSVPQAIRLTEGSMELMTMRVVSGSQEWQVDNPAPVEIFLMTRNPQVLSYVRRRLDANAAENAADQLEIASYSAEQVSQLLDARFATSDAGLSQESRNGRSIQLQRWTAIQNRLERGWQSLQARQPQSATAIAFEVLDLTQAMMHEGFLAATSNLTTPQSSPFVLTPGTLKYHWLVAEACSRSQWQSVPIPGSQFTDLAEMLQSGWSQQRRLQEIADLRVELVPGSDNGPRSLRLAAYSKSAIPFETAESTNSIGEAAANKVRANRTSQPIPGGYEGASLRVRSAGFPVRKGQFVRITAQAQIRSIGLEPTSGVLFYDNQAGPSLGQLVRGVVGQRVPIELYRFVTADGEFRILAEVRGECDVQLENLTASVIEPATQRRSYVTTPLEGNENRYNAVESLISLP